jgi:EF hand
MKTGSACLAVMCIAVLAAGCASPRRGSRPETPADRANDSYGGGAMSAPPAALMLAALDTNQDQKIEKSEVEAGADRAFESADTDHNGAVSIVELSEWSKVWLGDAYALPGHYQFDEDQNDRISREEFHDMFRRLFAQFDLNTDGVLDRTELLTMSMPAMGRGYGRGGFRGGGGRRGGGPDDDGGDQAE